MHKTTWGHFLARREIRTNKYTAVSKKLTLEAVKLRRLLSFSHKLQSVNKVMILAQVLEEYHVMTSKNINMLGDLKTDAFEL